MKRGEFVRIIGLMGVGIVLAPTRFSVASTRKTYRLPTPAIHIPHGNFANTQVETVFIRELGLHASIQHFMRNGVDPSTDDVSVVTFSKDNELMIVSFDAEKCIQTGQISGLHHMTLTDRSVLANAEFELEWKAGTDYLSLYRKA